jgi:hypothetical protein
MFVSVPSYNILTFKSMRSIFFFVSTGSESTASSTCRNTHQLSIVRSNNFGSLEKILWEMISLCHSGAVLWSSFNWKILPHYNTDTRLDWNEDFGDWMSSMSAINYSIFFWRSCCCKCCFLKEVSKTLGDVYSWWGALQSARWKRGLNMQPWMMLVFAIADFMFKVKENVKLWKQWFVWLGIPTSQELTS